MVHFLLGDLFLHFELVSAAVPAAAHGSRLGVSRAQVLAAAASAHLLALQLAALRGRGHGRGSMMVVVVAVVVTVVLVVLSEKHVVHVRGGGSAARAGF